MSREVCGICWCPYDEETGECACEPEPKKQHMTTLRTAAQQALEALEAAEVDPHSSDAVHKAIDALRAALAEPEDWELRRLREELERCKQTCAAISEAWREEAALAEPVQERNFCPRCGKRTQDIHTCTPP